MLLVNIKLLLLDCCDADRDGRRLDRKMAKARASGKCRLPLVSIAAGYGARPAPRSLNRLKHGGSFSRPIA